MSVSKPDPSGGSAGRIAARNDAPDQGGTPMRVLALDPSGSTRARCAGSDGIPVTVEAALIRPIEPGAIVLVHAGLALVRLDEEWVP
ncbi:MAG: HypC/HybG/HupF family hydrogenase formation chaperone [Conexibacter sp.]